MRIKTAITGFAVVLVVMSLIGGFSAFLRHYILGTPHLVEVHDVQIKELQEKVIDKEE